MKKIIVIIILLLSFILVDYTLRSHKTLSQPEEKDNFGKITKGMTTEQVKAMLGGPADFETYLSNDNETYLAYYFMKPHWTCISSGAGCVMVDTHDEKVPYVFKDNLLIGWGDVFLRSSVKPKKTIKRFKFVIGQKKEKIIKLYGNPDDISLLGVSDKGKKIEIVVYCRKRERYSDTIIATSYYKLVFKDDKLVKIYTCDSTQSCPSRVDILRELNLTLEGLPKRVSNLF